MNRWDDNDAFWAQMRCVVFRAERMDAAPREANLIVDLLNLAAGDAVLDIPCGIGRHTVELARLGLRLTGVDRYQPYVDETRSRAADAGVSAEVIAGDMREFIRTGAFDAAINMFTSFGYFDDAHEELRVLRNIHESLKPGGRILMEMAGKEIVARSFQQRVWYEADGGIVFEHRAIVDGWRRLRTRCTYVREGDAAWRCHHHDLRLFSAGELIELLNQAGFADCAVYGGLEGEPYDEKARRLVVAARKPE